VKNLCKVTCWSTKEVRWWYRSRWEYLLAVRTRCEGAGQRRLVEGAVGAGVRRCGCCGGGSALTSLIARIRVRGIKLVVSFLVGLHVVEKCGCCHCSSLDP
jgi:hypothetical protein